jgi:hypothetical protein
LRRDRLVETEKVWLRVKQATDARGIRLIAAFPPNTASIVEKRLPSWARGDGRRTEPDVMLAWLASNNIEAVDLRPVLKSAAEAGNPVYYLHDTHWSLRGAQMAFNTIQAALGSDRIRLATDTTPDPKRPRVGGDLARMLALGIDVEEPEYPLSFRVTGAEQVLEPEHVITRNSPRTGPRIVILGDSFTRMFLPMLAQYTSSATWIWHGGCGFDWKWIDMLHPDEIWWMPTERFMLCKPNVGPVGLL